MCGQCRMKSLNARIERFARRGRASVAELFLLLLWQRTRRIGSAENRSQKSLDDI